ncbi:hypothetical protein ACFQ0B_14590 [Nonomuraea thailandensis]
MSSERRVRATACAARPTLVPTGSPAACPASISRGSTVAKASRSCCLRRPTLSGPCWSAALAGCV